MKAEYQYNIVLQLLNKAVQKFITDIAVARSKYFNTTTNLISCNAAFAICLAQNADCTSYNHSFKHGDTPSFCVIKKRQISINRICKNNSFTFAQIQSGSLAQKIDRPGIYIMNMYKSAGTNFLGIVRKFRFCTQLVEYSLWNMYCVKEFFKQVKSVYFEQRYKRCGIRNNYHALTASFCALLCMAISMFFISCSTSSHVWLMYGMPISAYNSIKSHL